MILGFRVLGFKFFRALGHEVLVYFRVLGIQGLF